MKKIVFNWILSKLPALWAWVREQRKKNDDPRIKALNEAIDVVEVYKKASADKRIDKNELGELSKQIIELIDAVAKCFDIDITIKTK